jgi:antiviral helicase SKI2
MEPPFEVLPGWPGEGDQVCLVAAAAAAVASTPTTPHHPEPRDNLQAARALALAAPLALPLPVVGELMGTATASTDTPGLRMGEAELEVEPGTPLPFPASLLPGAQRHLLRPPRPSPRDAMAWMDRSGRGVPDFSLPKDLLTGRIRDWMKPWERVPEEPGLHGVVGSEGLEQPPPEGVQGVQGEEEEEETFLQQLAQETVAPGLERGLGGSAFSAAAMLEALLEDEMVDQVPTPLGPPSPTLDGPDSTNPGSATPAPPQEVDELLPADGALVLPPAPSHPDLARQEWAISIDVNQPFPDFAARIGRMAMEFPFELDTFQKRAVYHLERQESVFVAAHTSAGKTVVAEYAIALAMQHMTRVIYTSPIKALSNQKYRDFKGTFGEENVGICTGDVQIRPEAAILVMTTEILKSMLYRNAEMIADVEFVCFDEVHYVNDVERGVVWEEVLIMLPASITLILLSATVPNTHEFADWIGRTKRKPIYVVSTHTRPVPLEYHLFHGGRIFHVVNARKEFLPLGYKEAHDSVHPPAPPPSGAKGTKGQQQPSSGSSGAAPSKGPKLKAKEKGYNSQKGGPPVPGGRGGERSNKTNLYHDVIHFLLKQDLVPVIIFCFSKRKCEIYADSLSSLNMTSAAQKSEIHVFMERCLARLKGDDRHLPQILRMRELLLRGIGVHHSGVLPILKEMTEILFTRGLIQVLFATETFAMGVGGGGGGGGGV